MDESLVDAEGFPRNDVDVYQVRTARNKIISKIVTFPSFKQCLIILSHLFSALNNDARAIMQQIETKLYELHALAPVDANAPSR